ncbi:lipopolysaccharide biosynthesis protein [Lentzea sp. NPDC058436]|uniref:lipopolysaccharide biosynthesis protein n=1 Tax=Lentzea sp. NPDC058436 TaxID=3346499 RepID=UPI003661AD46
METSAALLMGSSVLTGLLGVAYWIIAEQLFPTESVGRASAVISTATMLSSLACLSFGGSYQRFLPAAGGLAGRLVGGGLAISAVTAVVFGAGFVALGIAGERMFQSTVERWVFPLVVLVFTAYALLDPVLTGLRRAGAVAVKNVSVSVVKILPLPLLAFTASGFALTTSWAVVSAVITLVIVAGPLRRGLAANAGVAPDLPPVRQLWEFQGASFAMTVVLTATPLCLPLIVLAQLGPENSAYYNLVAALSTAAGMLRANVLASYVVEASVPGADRPALTRRMVRLMAGVCALTAVGFATAGPVLLHLVGPGYAEAAVPLVLVLAAEALVAGVVAVYAAVAQVVRRLRLLVSVQVLIVAGTVGGAAALVGDWGLTGVGIAGFASNALAVVLLFAPLRALLRDVTR